MSGSAYIRWAKSRERFRYNLGRSSIRPCLPEALGLEAGDLAISGSNAHGWAPLREALATRYRVPTESVTLAVGCSMANHLVCSALLRAGDHVLVERPGYPPLLELPAWLGATVERFERGADGDLDADAIAERLRPDTRLVVLSDPHNPTGRSATPARLDQLADMARERDFHVLVDEVYREFSYRPGDTIGAHRGEHWISTCSLTKAYGLDGLRAGWIVSSPELGTRIRELNDLFGIIMPHPSERLALRALERAHELRTEVEALLEVNRPLAAALVARRADLDWRPPDSGPVGWVRLRGGRVDALVELLEQRHDATLTPGRFFGDPTCFRLGFGMITEDLEAGLDLLEIALDELNSPAATTGEPR